MLERYIFLGDTIIDREKIILLFRDNNDPAKVWVQFDYGREAFDGDDAQTLWDSFGAEKDWT